MELRVEGLDKLLENFSRAPEATAEALAGAVLEMELLLQREVQDRTPTVHGTLRNSILAQEPRQENGGIVGLVGTPVIYAVPVELGTKPHRPPIEPLIDWARHALGLDENEAEGVAWAVAKKIQKFGTEGAFMFRGGFEAARPQLPAILARSAGRLVQKLAGG